VTLLVARLLSAAAIGRASPSWLSQACSHQILRDGHGGCPTMRRSLSSSYPRSLTTTVYRAETAPRLNRQGTGSGSRAEIQTSRLARQSALFGIMHAATSAAGQTTGKQFKNTTSGLLSTCLITAIVVGGTCMATRAVSSPVQNSGLFASAGHDRPSSGRSPSRSRCSASTSAHDGWPRSTTTGRSPSGGGRSRYSPSTRSCA